MKWKYVIIFCFLGVIAFYFIRIAYPVLQISSVYPPMKEYNFSLTTAQLANEIIKIANDDSNLNFKITDTTGTSKDNFKYYADVYLKNDTTIYSFNLFYNQSGKRNSKINLVGAFDKTHKFGGYQINNKDIQSLITVFENKFIDRINYNQ